MIPRSVFNFTAPREIMGVEMKSFAKKTLTPLAIKTLAVVSANSSPAKRQSCPSTMLGDLCCFNNHFAVASVTRATLSTVKSSAIIALQPSVPNLIFVMFCKRKTNLIKISGMDVCELQFN